MAEVPDSIPIEKIPLRCFSSQLRGRSSEVFFFFLKEIINRQNYYITLWHSHWCSFSSVQLDKVFVLMEFLLDGVRFNGIFIWYDVFIPTEFLMYNMLVIIGQCVTFQEVPIEQGVRFNGTFIRHSFLFYEILIGKVFNLMVILLDKIFVPMGF